MADIQISFIVPAYNAGKYLAECIDSILMQSVEKEIIIINDGSTDNTASIAAEYARQHQNIRLINQENSGLSVSRNVGMTAAQGEYICFIDSDDVFLYDFSKDFYESAKKYNLGMISGYYLRFDSSSSKSCEHETTYNDKVVSFCEYLCKTMEEHSLEVIACNRLFRRELLTSLGLTFRPGMYYEDKVFTLELLLRAKDSLAVQTSSVTYGYRANPSGITGRKTTQKHFRDYCNVLLMELDLISKFANPDNKKAAMQYFSQSAQGAISKYGRLGVSDREACKSVIRKDVFREALCYADSVRGRMKILSFLINPAFAVRIFHLQLAMRRILKG